MRTYVYVANAYVAGWLAGIVLQVNKVVRVENPRANVESVSLATVQYLFHRGLAAHLTLISFAGLILEQAQQ